MKLCDTCAADTTKWLDAITPGPHRPYPWEPQPVGRFRVEDAHNPHARTSVGAQMLRVVRSQLRVIRTICARDHASTGGDRP